MNEILTSHPLIEQILTEQDSLQDDYDLYRNHVYRVFNLTMQLMPSGIADTDELAVAAAYHDIGIWTAGTFDYLRPSIVLAEKFITENSLLVDKERVKAIIENHHKLSTYKDDIQVESFRKADLVDLSSAFFTFGVSRGFISHLNIAFPSLGFRRFILRHGISYFWRHPWNPLPMIKR